MPDTFELLKKSAFDAKKAELEAAVHSNTVAAQNAAEAAQAAQEIVFDTVSKAIVFVEEDDTTLTIAYGSQVQITDVDTPYGPGLEITFN